MHGPATTTILFYILVGMYLTPILQNRHQAEEGYVSWLEVRPDPTCLIASLPRELTPLGGKHCKIKHHTLTARTSNTKGPSASSCWHLSMQTMSSSGWPSYSDARIYSLLFHKLWGTMTANQNHTSRPATKLSPFQCSQNFPEQITSLLAL